MSHKSATVWNYDGYQLMGDSESPYYLMCFTATPAVIAEPLVLKTGDVLHPGDTLAYLGGKKTSAGFEYLHPVDPFLFRYAGLYVDGEVKYALWETGVDGNEEFAAIYYSHAIMEEDGMVKSLLFTNRAGSGRVIEAEIFHATHETVPRSLYPLPYQIEMGWAS